MTKNAKTPPPIKDDPLPSFKATGASVVHPYTGKRFTRDAAVPHVDDDWTASAVRRHYLTRTA